MTIQCITCRYLDTKTNEAPCNHCENFNMWETQEYRTVEELEKVKEEMNEYMIASFFDNEDYKWINMCLDKHINELKGENNETDN